MLHPTLLLIARKEQETDDAFSFFLQLPETQIENFTFSAGQYLSIAVDLGSRGKLKRAYSICTRPGSKDFGFTVKRVKNGLVSNFLADQVNEGDRIWVYPPEGSFTLGKARNAENPFVFIAAGSGITPVFSMISHLHAIQPSKKMYLLYGNRNEEQVIYKEKIEALKAEAKRLECKYVFSQPLNQAVETSRITTRMIEDLFGQKQLDKYATDVFVCGPEGLIECARIFFSTNNINESHLHYELFWQPRHEPLVLPQTAAPESVVIVKLDGIEYTIPMISGETVLDKLLEKNVDAPYTCQNGTCSTCKAKVLAGRMGMITCKTLEESEIAEGFVLTCQAYPESERVVLDFDY